MPLGDCGGRIAIAIAPVAIIRLARQPSAFGNKYPVAVFAAAPPQWAFRPREYYSCPRFRVFLRRGFLPQTNRIFFIRDIEPSPGQREKACRVRYSVPEITNHSCQGRSKKISPAFLRSSMRCARQNSSNSKFRCFLAPTYWLRSSINALKMRPGRFRTVTRGLIRWRNFRSTSSSIFFALESCKSLSISRQFDLFSSIQKFRTDSKNSMRLPRSSSSVSLLNSSRLYAQNKRPGVSTGPFYLVLTERQD
jgi:hypothetical protein